MVYTVVRAQLKFNWLAKTTEHRESKLVCSFVTASIRFAMSFAMSCDLSSFTRMTLK